MFGHSQTSPSDHKGRRRRDVEGMGSVAASAAGIDHIGIANRDTNSTAPHRPHGTSDFVNGFTLETQPHQIRSDLGGLGYPIHDSAHDLFAFLLRQRDAVVKLGNGVLEHDQQLSDLTYQLAPNSSVVSRLAEVGQL